jgi:hypothetical protein
MAPPTWRKSTKEEDELDLPSETLARRGGSDAAEPYAFAAAGEEPGGRGPVSPMSAIEPSESNAPA